MADACRGPEGANGQLLGTHGAAVAAQAPDRPLQGGGKGPGLRAAEGTARGSWAGLWARPMVYIPGGWGTASACPVPHAIRRPG